MKNDRDTFFNLLQYQLVDKLTNESSLNYIQHIFDTKYNNSCTHDIVDYDRMIYIKQQFKDDPEIQKQFEQWETQVAYNYAQKQKMLARLQLRDHM